MEVRERRKPAVTALIKKDGNNFGGRKTANEGSPTKNY